MSKLLQVHSSQIQLVSSHYQHVNVFVEEENIRYCGGLAATVIDGGSITLVPAVSGGTFAR